MVPVAGRFPGLRVFASCRLPGVSSSGFRNELAAYSCGGSRGIGDVLLTAFPLGPWRGTDDVQSFSRILSRRNRKCDIAGPPLR
jgi:hypothetical protein